MAEPVKIIGSSASVRTGKWTHGLCGCFDDFGLCIVAYFVPCVPFGQTAEYFGKSCLLHGIAYMFCPISWCLQAKQRAQLRNIRGIPGTAVNDCCVTLWCPLCALVQEAQEAKELRTQTNVTPVTSSPTLTSAGGSGIAQQVAAPGGGYTGPAGYVPYVPPPAKEKMSRE